MGNEIVSLTEVATGEVRPLRDRLGWLDEWRVDRVTSKEAYGALARIEQHRIAAVERTSCFAIDVATDKVIGTMAAAAVEMAGAIEVRLSTNAGAAGEALDQVEVARVVASIGARNATLAEIAEMHEAGDIGDQEQRDLATVLERQHRRRMADAQVNAEASRKRMQIIVGGGFAAGSHLNRGE
jgi:hypothetical protein